MTKLKNAKPILAVLSALLFTIGLCATIVAVADAPMSDASDYETTPTTTAVFCYATQLDYDDTPMQVGETRAIRFYHPSTLTASGCSVDSVSDNIAISYEEGDDTVYVTALAAGDAKLYIRENDCAFGAYAYLTVAAAPLNHDVTRDGATNMMDVAMLYNYASGKIMLPQVLHVTEPFNKYGDVNSDGIINTMDAMALYRLVSGTK